MINRDLTQWMVDMLQSSQGSSSRYVRQVGLYRGFRTEGTASSHAMMDFPWIQASSFWGDSTFMELPYIIIWLYNYICTHHKPLVNGITTPVRLEVVFRGWRSQLGSPNWGNNTCYTFPYIGNNHPSWLSYFSEGWLNQFNLISTEPDSRLYSICMFLRPRFLRPSAKMAQHLQWKKWGGSTTNQMMLSFHKSGGCFQTLQSGPLVTSVTSCRTQVWITSSGVRRRSFLWDWGTSKTDGL